MILLNDFKRLWTEASADVHAAVEAVGSSGWYILGREVEAFEAELAPRFGHSHAAGLASGLDAIEIGLRCVGCGPGDRVLLPPISAFATALAVLRIGAIPVFCDCDRFGLMDLARAERALAADPSIRFAVPVHLYGHAIDLGGLRRLGDRYGAIIVEDCAQAIGASHQGAPCGSAGTCAAVSFYPTKNLGAMGDGGALVTSSEAIVSRSRCLRDYGQSSKYVHVEMGFNSRLDELQAAILRRVFLPRLDEWTARRREIAQAYIDGFDQPLIEVPGAPAGSKSCWHLFPVLAPRGRKRELMAHLREAGIQSAEHYPTALFEQPAMNNYPFELAGGNCPAAIEFCARQVSLPIHPYLDDGEVDRVTAACNSWK